jgi:uncharacterized membrane protein YgaE (UPF0421/DUF939 family)
MARGGANLSTACVAKSALIDGSDAGGSAAVQSWPKSPAGATLALIIAQLLKLDYPIFAFIAAVTVTDLRPAQTRDLGLVRVMATFVGALLGATLSPLLPAEAWSVGLSVMIAILVAEVLRAREGGRVAGYICGLIVLDQNIAPWHYATFRFVETVLGVSVAWLISYVPKLIRVEGPGEQ